MKAYIRDLDEKCGNALKEFCRNNSVMYSYSIKDDNIYEVFKLYIDDSVMLVTSAYGVAIIKIIVNDYVCIASDMFGYMEIM